MNRTALHASASLAALAGAASLIVVTTQSACSQPQTLCTASASVAYAAKYAETTPVDANCPVSGLKGDTIGFAAFNPSLSGREPGKEIPDFSRVTLAARTHLLGALVAHANDYGIVDETEGNLPHAFGPFASAVPDENDICTAALEPAKQALPEVPADEGDPADPEDDIPAQPALDMVEEWSGVQVYVTAANLGTQVKAHYKITDAVAGCSAEYDVLAVFPAVFCDDGEGNPVDDLCNAEAQPEKGIPVGSGISPDYPVKCDPELLLCVVDADPSTETFPVLIGGE